MSRLLIADSDIDTRKKVANLLIQEGYNVMVTDSVASVLEDTLKKTAEVIILGSACEDLKASELIPLLKKCNKQVAIILVSDETSLPLIRKVRKEGIFFHALKSFEPEGRQEIIQAVKCAFKNLLNSRTPCRNY